MTRRRINPKALGVRRGETSAEGLARNADLVDATAAVQERRQAEQPAGDAARRRARRGLLPRGRAARLRTDTLDDIRQPPRRLEGVCLLLEELVVGCGVLSLLRRLLQRAGVRLRVGLGERLRLRGVAERAELLRSGQFARGCVLRGAEPGLLLRVELALRVREIGRVQTGDRRIVGDVLLTRERGLRHAGAVAAKRSGADSRARQRRRLLRVLLSDLRLGGVDHVILIGILVLLELRA